MNPQSRPNLNRRRFLANTLLAGASASLAVSPSLSAESNVNKAAGAPERKIKLGLIGCGGRGSWIAGLFKKHGGFEIHAVADYFPEAAKAAGDALGVEAGRRFSTLSAYKRVLESGKFGSTNFVCSRLECALGIDVSKLETWVVE